MEFLPLKNKDGTADRYGRMIKKLTGNGERGLVPIISPARTIISLSNHLTILTALVKMAFETWDDFRATQTIVVSRQVAATGGTVSKPTNIHGVPTRNCHSNPPEPKNERTSRLR